MEQFVRNLSEPGVRPFPAETDRSMPGARPRRAGSGALNAPARSRLPAAGTGADNPRPQGSTGPQRIRRVVFISGTGPAAV